VSISRANGKNRQLEVSLGAGGFGGSLHSADSVEDLVWLDKELTGGLVQVIRGAVIERYGDHIIISVDDNHCMGSRESLRAVLIKSSMFINLPSKLAVALKLRAYTIVRRKSEVLLNA
jgi:hypothetical protein